MVEYKILVYVAMPPQSPEMKYLNMVSYSHDYSYSYMQQILICSVQIVTTILYKINLITMWVLNIQKYSLVASYVVLYIVYSSYGYYKLIS